MDPRTTATSHPDPDAVEFIRFCYRRRRVGWPELYDEMCAVAARGLYRGYGADDLATLGIGFGLFDLPALAAIARTVVEEELAQRRPVTVIIASAISEPEAAPSAATASEPVLVSEGDPVTPTTSEVDQSERRPAAPWPMGHLAGAAAGT
jgi:hypothetical protein